MMEHPLFVLVDLLGTVAFAISGTAAATQRRLDLFGAYAVAFLTACGGGLARDVCIGTLPPVGITDWRYLACSAAAATMAMVAGPRLRHLHNPVAFFDSIGLGFFAVAGAHKVLASGGNVESAIVLGTVTAIGGGVMRDVLMNRVPVILEKEIYALAAVVAASIQAVAEVNGWSSGLAPWVAIAACLVIRIFATRRGWALPVVGGRSSAPAGSGATPD